MEKEKIRLPWSGQCGVVINNITRIVNGQLAVGQVGGGSHLVLLATRGVAARFCRVGWVHSEVVTPTQSTPVPTQCLGTTIK